MKFIFNICVLMLIILNSSSLALAAPRVNPNAWQWVCSNKDNTWNWYIAKRAPENFDGSSCTQRVLTVVSNEKYAYSIIDEAFCWDNGHKYYMFKKLTEYDKNNKILSVRKDSKWQEPIINSAAENLWDAVNLQLQNYYGSDMYGNQDDEVQICPNCNGTGSCPNCDGTGVVIEPVGPEPGGVFCWTCFGSGQCQRCSGSGSI